MKHVKIFGVLALITFIAMSCDGKAAAVLLFLSYVAATAYYAFAMVRALFRSGTGALPKAKSTGVPIVALAVSRPLIGAPTLQQAYQALPGYCAKVLGGAA